MTAIGDGDGVFDDQTVVHRVGQGLTHTGLHVQLHVHDEWLKPALFVRMDADGRLDGQAADENLGCRRAQAITSGVRQPRLWPPSTASIWPVTEGASMK